MTNFDAVVLGAGPAGGAAALALARAGRAVAIVEKAGFPRRKVCGEFLSATNLALLDRLGVGKAWEAAAGPKVARVALFSGEARIEAPMPSGGGFGRALGRDRLDTLLLDAACDAGVTVFQPWQAVGIRKTGAVQSVALASKDGQTTVTAPVVIAAHGSWEPGTLPTQSRHAHGPGDYLGFKAHFHGAALAPDLMPLLVFPGGYGGMVWADAGRLSVSLCIRRDALEAVRARFRGLPAGEAVGAHLAAHCAGARDVLAGAALHGAWLAAGPIRPGMRAPFADDIFRVGNLAGESHPIIAEGISMAMQSGWLLADALAPVDLFDAQARAGAGRRYADAWRRQFVARIRAAALLAGLTRVPAAAALVAFAAGRVPRLLTWGATLSGKTKPVPGLGLARAA